MFLLFRYNLLFSHTILQRLTSSWAFAMWLFTHCHCAQIFNLLFGLCSLLRTNTCGIIYVVNLSWTQHHIGSIIRLIGRYLMNVWLLPWLTCILQVQRFHYSLRNFVHSWFRLALRFLSFCCLVLEFSIHWGFNTTFLACTVDWFLLGRGWIICWNAWAYLAIRCKIISTSLIVG